MMVTMYDERYNYNSSAMLAGVEAKLLNYLYL
jgi:hypothetical protein